MVDASIAASDYCDRPSIRSIPMQDSHFSILEAAAVREAGHEQTWKFPTPRCNAACRAPLAQQKHPRRTEMGRRNSCTVVDRRVRSALLVTYVLFYRCSWHRHGESQWNLENRFTGWYNIQLSPKGEKEAAEGGRLINEAGYKFGENGQAEMCVTFRKAAGPRGWDTRSCRYCP